MARHLKLRTVSPGGAEYKRLLHHVDPAKRICAMNALTALKPDELVPHVHGVAALLVDDCGAVRATALDTFSRLSPKDLAKHARDILAMTEDDDKDVCSLAMSLLGHLDPDQLATTLADSLAAKLESRCAGMRVWALKLLGLMRPEEVGKYAQLCAQRLNDDDWVARAEALKTLGMLDPDDLALHTEAVGELLGDSLHGRVRTEALNTLGKLKTNALARHAVEVVAMLRDGDPSVRSSALRVIEGDPEGTIAVGVVADMVETMLDADNPETRVLVMRALDSLAPDALAEHGTHLFKQLSHVCPCVRSNAVYLIGRLGNVFATAGMLDDANRIVRMSAIGAMKRMSPAAVAPHAHLLAEVLTDDAKEVATAALNTLARLMPRALVHYAPQIAAMLDSLDPDFDAQYISTTITLLCRIEDAHVLARCVRALSRFEVGRKRLFARLPAAVIAGLDLDSDDAATRRRVIGRCAWFRARAATRRRSAALYWSSLPFRPGAAGYERSLLDVLAEFGTR